ncbi:uncharacterized protein LOC141535245 isoform X1 [Cotesia typhae]|uniref:uncharacterized protein LOC141535245 isoform X1 n=1 Tax=Cotesia typhae TaxID=2053667 RepID=UPI003D697E46
MQFFINFTINVVKMGKRNNSKNMPPTSVVSVELAVNVIKKYISHFVNGLPPWNSDVWKLIQKDSELKGKWTLGSVRTNIREDRRNILTEARRQCGILDPNSTKKSNKLDQNGKISNISYNTNEDEDSADDAVNDMSGLDSEEDDVDEQEPFTVELSRELWNEIKNQEPLVYKGRKYIGFKPRVWTNKISFAFF